MTAEHGNGAEAYVSPAGDGKALPLMGLLKASGRQTGGALEVIEYHGDTRMQPPPHIHAEREEAFYVLDGRFDFTVGDEVIEAGPGAWAFIPRGTRHGFSADPGSRALIFIMPAGMEGFFDELGSGLASGKTSQEMRGVLKGRYDSLPA
jgi:quercetin dioxygenase-like cupin family protein